MIELLLPVLSIALVVIVILVILGIIVIVHEFGHFIVARKAGVLVEEFGLGIPPRLFGVQRIQGKWVITKGTKHPENIDHTLYSINSLPIGGFVRLYGDGAGGEGGAVDPHYVSRSFESASVWWRAAIMVAGVSMNVVLAVFIYYVLLSKSGFVSDRLPLIGNPSFAFGTVEQSIGVSGVVDGSPADVAGLKAEEIVLRVRPQTDDADWIIMQKPDELISIVKQNEGVPIEIEVKDFTSGAMRVVVIEPAFNKEEGRVMIGAGLMNLIRIRYDQGIEPYFAGVLHAWNIASYNFQAIGSVVSFAVEEKRPEIIGETVTGPVGIGRVIDKILKSSGEKLVENLLNITAIISLSLATVNILPLPALDGGRLMFLIPEVVTGRRVNRKFEQYVNVAGFILLIGLSILITIKDVIHLW